MIPLKVINQELPAGIEDNGYEFFWSNRDQVLKCTHAGRVWIWGDFPQEAIDIVCEDMAAHPEVILDIRDWNVTDKDEMIALYIFCRFGKFDTEPDINANGTIGYAEYFDCGKRGTCKYEGRICTTLKVENGELTKRELETLKLVAKGKLNKEIADIMEISEHTVNSHITNIQQKGNFFKKYEMILFAKDKNLI
ncbi:helix-turn-helix transcriptional regulator [Sphingobacterium multivorum]|uniref:response regulator transcription factor n=1 Tax=Sphingobacterium multivorum TaxID=28454 RepID=UPI003019A91E